MMSNFSPDALNSGFSNLGKMNGKVSLHQEKSRSTLELDAAVQSGNS